MLASDQHEPGLTLEYTNLTQLFLKTKMPAFRSGILPITLTLSYWARLAVIGMVPNWPITIVPAN